MRDILKKVETTFRQPRMETKLYYGKLYIITNNLWLIYITRTYMRQMTSEPTGFILK